MARSQGTGCEDISFLGHILQLSYSAVQPHSVICQTLLSSFFKYSLALSKSASGGLQDFECGSGNTPKSIARKCNPIL